MRLSKLALAELFASLRERRRRSLQQSYEEGGQIRRRLQELLGVSTPMQEVETHPSNANSETDPHVRPQPNSQMEGRVRCD
jgi:hypothetical protein